ncbi:MAG: enoyl-CoA hydratase-related protein [Myxococcota bacterium]|nr:enoyl-CoA hydratase-related protein [Myxococcota bacterium]
MPDLVLVQRDDDVALLTFNDPERRNAMTRAMGEAFSAASAELAREPSLRCVVLTGAGRGFSAGGDLGMIQAQSDAGRADPEAAQPEIRDTMRAFYGLFLSVREIGCPTIAALNGAAIGAGLCVALACDLRIASKDAKLGLNFARLGLHPGMGATWTLPRLVGPAHAAELLFTGRTLTGAEAAGIGLVNRAVPAAEVLPTARALAGEIAAAGPIANRGIKRALARSAGASLDDQLTFEASVQAETFATEDAREGLDAAKERRAPRFSGR